MTFKPMRAACIFGASLLLPLAFFLVLIRPAAGIVGLMLGLVALSAALFWAGARIAGRAHTLKSLLRSILAIWVFSFSTAGLGRQFPGMVEDYIVPLLQFAFVFAASWLMVPRVHATAQGPAS
jgi:hypothetical protein